MLFPVALPPGIFSAGTDYAAKGRYTSCDLIRFFGPTIQPIGGWVPLSLNTFDGMARSLMTWTDNNNQPWVGVGTNQGLFAMPGGGTLTNITPAGFVDGSQDATIGGGYGSGVYGSGLYGVPIGNVYKTIPASSWTLDTFGQNLVGVMDDDGTLYEWAPNLANPAVAIANAPQAYSLVTTQEGILMALGADLDPNYIKWSDIQNNTVWTPSSTNQSRDQILETQGRIMTGKKVPGGVLVLTDEGAFIATYVNVPFVYTFQRVGSGCGIVSRQAIAVTQSATYWMGRNGFYQYNGYVATLACDMQDDIFPNLNDQQISKVSAIHNADFNEVWWLYPTKDSIEVNAYVAYNYAQGLWYGGRMNRTCGTGSNGVLNSPVMAGTDGYIYSHEVGNLRDGRTPRLRSAPFEVVNGERTMKLTQFVPDELAEGRVSVNLYGRIAGPQAAEVAYGPYSSVTPQDIRMTGRQFSLEFLGEPDEDFRLGMFRFEAVESSRR